jgi:hypothetical protein
MRHTVEGLMKLSRLIPAVALLAAGCASPTVAGKPPASYAPADLVLRVDTAGGLLPVSATVTNLPELSVYGDGRVVTVGPVPEIYPGPALPNVQVVHISRADVSALARRALEAGVGNGEDTGTPNVADAPSTHITVRTDSGLVDTVVLALGIDADELSREQRAARERMKELVDALAVLPQTLGKGAVSSPAAYEPSRIAAVATEWRPSDTLPSDPPAVRWPGSVSLPGPAVPNRPSVNCVDVEAGPVLAAAKGANARTPWVSGSARWSVQFRPLLPDESSCADLTR